MSYVKTQELDELFMSWKSKYESSEAKDFAEEGYDLLYTCSILSEDIIIQ